MDVTTPPPVPVSSGGLLTTSISQCQNDHSYPNFFGTSAATPHAAGIAALMLQADPSATPAQIYGSLRSSALPMSTSTPNFSSGYGFIQADAALVIPTLSLSVPSIPLGSTATLTWTSMDATGCTASGSGSGISANWTGAQATSGNVIADADRGRHANLHVDVHECVRHVRGRDGHPSGLFGHASGGPHVDAGLPLRHRRKLDDAGLVLRERDELHRVRRVERNVGHERQRDDHPSGRGTSNLHAHLQ